MLITRVEEQKSFCRVASRRTSCGPVNMAPSQWALPSRPRFTFAAIIPIACSCPRPPTHRRDPQPRARALALTHAARESSCRS